MYRSVLVPLDGTAFGEQALPVALEICRRTGAVMHLVHVHTPGSAWTPLEGMMPGASTLRPVTQAEDRQYLEATLATVGGDAPPRGDVRVLEGPVGRSVAEGARAAEVDLVVMSTHGRTGLSRLWHHDVAGYLTRHLNVPIVAVPVPVEGQAAPPRTSLSHVLVPLGGRPSNASVLDNVGAFCQALGGRATVLRVVEPPVEVGYTLLGQDGHVNHYLLEDLDDAARGYLAEAAARLKAKGVPVEMAVVHGANPAEAVLEYSRSGLEGGADAIALETHGLGTMRHLFSASVVEEVLHGATVPVLLHHADASAEAEHAYEDTIRSGMGWARHHEAPQVTPPVA